MFESPYLTTFHMHQIGILVKIRISSAVTQQLSASSVVDRLSRLKGIESNGENNFGSTCAMQSCCQSFGGPI